MPIPFLAALAISAGMEGIKAFAGNRANKAAQKRADTAAAQANLNKSLGGPAVVQDTGGPSATPFDYTGLDEQLQRKLYDQIFGTLMGGGKPGVGAAG
jgi:hypothetical protein